jgi:hypothetical protein
MILRLTVCGLVILLIVIISLSYYVNKEGFETLTNSKQNNIGKDLLNVSKDRYQLDVDKNILKNELSSNSDKSVLDKQLAKVRDDVIQLDADKKILAEDRSSVPQRNDIVPEITLSESGYNAMDLQQRINILKDIQKLVKNDLILNRNLLGKEELQNNESGESASLMQGKEYEEGCSKPKDNNNNDCYQDTEFRCPKNPDGSCPPLPDMTKYIKKDSIPCWGCNIDY